MNRAVWQGGLIRAARRQRGAALIMVLLLVALMLILSVGLVEGVRYNSQRLLNQRYMDQGFWYAYGGEILAGLALEDVAGEETINLAQDWARQDILFPIEGGSIAGNIVDEQACFNVNSLYPPNREGDQGAEADPPSLKLFRSLAENLGISTQRAEFIIGRLQDWIDEDYSPEGIYGAEDLSYSSGEYPFMPPNGLIDSLSELSLFADYEEGEEASLLPFLCALPEVDTKININTLGPEDAPLLAAAVGNLISVESASQLIESRPETGWSDVATFLVALNLPAESQLPADLQTTLDIKSHYFKGLADVYFENRRLRIFSRFVLKGNKAIAYSREYGEVF